MNYILEIADTEKHFIKITTQINCLPNNILHLQLPSWRPGRYQLANYAKYIRNFNVKNSNGKTVSFKKSTKDCWQIDVLQENNICIEYEFYANQFDAGGCYVDEDVLYINPVNCLLYNPQHINTPCKLYLKLPKSYKIACQLQVNDFLIEADDFHKLADSPLIASAHLFHHQFKFNEYHFHFWIYGKNPLNNKYMIQLQDDTLLYAALQKNIFDDFPCNDYHFLYCFFPYKFRHGVEHENSTVIAMGFTEEDILEEFYDDLLAISSHELFHLWNIKRLRPVEMYPYDYSKENYSSLGYIYEGITTYYGDLALLRSGVWDFDKYKYFLQDEFNKHYNNSARFNYSIAASSFDSWLDGYEQGVEGRKVSIYTEGCIAALIADIMIIEATEGNKRLDDALRYLYNNTYKKNIGYSEADYKYALELVSGISFDDYFNQLIHGFGYWNDYINPTLNKIGLEILVQTNNKTVIKTLSNINQRQEKLLKVWIN